VVAEAITVPIPGSSSQCEPFRELIIAKSELVPPLESIMQTRGAIRSQKIASRPSAAPNGGTPARILMSPRALAEGHWGLTDASRGDDDKHAANQHRENHGR
jgi:hypothetical protein